MGCADANPNTYKKSIMGAIAKARVGAAKVSDIPVHLHDGCGWVCFMMYGADIPMLIYLHVWGGGYFQSDCAMWEWSKPGCRVYDVGC